MKKFLTRRIAPSAIAVVAFLAIVPAAFAHDNTIVGSATCTSQKNSMWTATFTVANDYKLSEVVHLSGGLNTTLNLMKHPGPGDVGSISIPGLTGSAVTETETGHWSDGFNSQPHSATVNHPPNCGPVQHSPQITGTAKCGTVSGRWHATYTLVNNDGGTGSVRLPMTRKGLTGKTDTLQDTFTFGNGPDVPVSATVKRPGTCVPNHTPPPPPPPVIRRPHARFYGPCLDPEYAVDMWNGVHANHDVTLIWRYLRTSGPGTVGTPTTVRVKLRPGQHFKASYRRILGNSRMTVRTASGTLVASITVVPPGEYGGCQAF